MQWACGFGNAQAGAVGQKPFLPQRAKDAPHGFAALQRRGET
jgi:hypothetical protein